ncbi:MAG: thiamine pyrophosphate-dependent enzyme [Dehalococcoidia bacterium]|nr:thiamine pyrophosphate-dependent enzyme [Dehalococcoidia bacterium]
MKAFYDTLKIGYGSCPTDCRACEEACAKARDGNVLEGGRIKSVHLPDQSFNGALTCIQCGEPQCQAVCPTGAIVKDAETGTVKVQEEKCVGCALCTLACPYGGIYYDQSKKKSFKCDRCDGDPKCVSACNYGVLSYPRNSVLRSHLKYEDGFAQGASLCLGCPAELAIRVTSRIIGPEAVIFGSPGCASSLIIGMNAQASTRLNGFFCLLDNTASSMTGVKRYFKKMGQDVRTVAFVGDGATVDIGFQALSGAAERGENIIYICYDNEAYMATGIQRSSSTSYLAWTNTTPIGKMRHGKETPGKNVPLLMVFHGAPYVATATIGDMEDYAEKLEKAMAVKEGLSYIHLLSPCPTGWRADTDAAIEICKMAVETNYYPLWEAENGRFRMTRSVQKVRPVSDFTSLMGRYSHLEGESLQALQRSVDDRFRLIQEVCQTWGG